MTPLQELKLLTKENDVPYFTDEELEYYLGKADGNVEDAAYRCLLIKSENTTLNVSGLTTTDSSTYFRRLAAMYCPNNSRILGGV